MPSDPLDVLDGLTDLDAYLDAVKALPDDRLWFALERFVNLIAPLAPAQQHAWKKRAQTIWPQSISVIDKSLDARTQEAQAAVVAAQGKDEDLLAGDIANAAILVADHGQDFRHSPHCGWLHWDERRWTPDATNAIMQRAKQVARSLLALLADGEDALPPGAFKAIIASQNATKLRAMVTLAQSEPPIPVRAADLDADGWLWNTPNATVELTTGHGRAHRREDLITKLSPVRYDPEAPCPRWNKFLLQIFGGDVAMVEFLRRFVGHCLTGDVSEDVFSIWWGVGGNGKTTLKETLLALFGDYALTTPAKTFLEQERGHIPNDIARLAGARLVVAAEPNARAKLATEVIKAMTGRDQQPARLLYKEWFTFAPTFKPILITNAKPYIEEVSVAIWRRVRLVPFEVQFQGTTKDKQLGTKLLAELPGILNWALAGLSQWQKDGGLGEAAKIIEATAEYQVESDWFSGFLHSQCERGPGIEDDAGALYRRYTVWAPGAGARIASLTAFGRMLTERGYRRRESDGKTYRLGLRLKNLDG